MANKSRVSARLERSPDTITRPIEQGAPRIDPELPTYLRRVFLQQVSSGADLRRYDEMVGQQQVIAFLEQLTRTQDNQ